MNGSCELGLDFSGSAGGKETLVRAEYRDL